MLKYWNKEESVGLFRGFNYYNWIFTTGGSSFRHLSKREQKQMKSLFFGRGSNAFDYICNNSLDYIDPRNIPYYYSGFLRNYKNDKEYLDDIGNGYFAQHINVKKLLEEKNYTKRINNGNTRSRTYKSYRRKSRIYR